MLAPSGSDVMLMKVLPGTSDPTGWTKTVMGWYTAIEISHSVFVVIGSLEKRILNGLKDVGIEGLEFYGRGMYVSIINDRNGIKTILSLLKFNLNPLSESYLRPWALDASVVPMVDQRVLD